MAAAAVPQNKAMNKFVQEKSLKELLDGLIKSQKQDIHAFSAGHLNESNLPKPPEKASHKPWKMALKQSINIVPKSVLPPPKRDTKHEDAMMGTMLNFSIGTSGNAYVPRKPKPTPVSKAPTVLSNRTKSSTMSKKSLKSDGVLIEELVLPEAMLLKTEYSESKLRLTRSLNALTSERMRTPPPSASGKLTTPREQLLPELRHRFVASHLEAVTKKDQLQKMQQFENEVIRKEDVMEQNVMSGVKAVSHLEGKLQQDLDDLKYRGYGPNFHRLQVFSNVFEDLIKESITFGYILASIKNEYDNYIASLLDGELTKPQILYNQVEQLTGRDSHVGILKNEIVAVHMLEDEAKQLLEENEKLRKELDREMFLKNKPAEEDETPFVHFREEPKPDILEQIEELKATILEKLDTMNALKTKLRMAYVPSTVCTHLEQCIKETEVEIQKLMSQKEFFERSIADMEQDLQQAIEAADTTEKDARRVWKRITAVKAINRNALHMPPGAGVTTTGPGGATPNPYQDSDDEQDDEQKWNWYIS